MYLPGINKLVSISECIWLYDYMTKTWTQTWSTFKNVEMKDFASTMERKECKGVGNRNSRKNKAVSPGA